MNKTQNKRRPYVVSKAHVYRDIMFKSNYKNYVFLFYCLFLDGVEGGERVKTKKDKLLVDRILKYIIYS